MLRLLAALLITSFGTAPSAAAWRVAETAHFVIYADMSAADLRRRAELLEDYRALLSRFTTAEADEAAPKLTIYIVDDIASAVPFRKIGPYVAGFYTANDRGIAAFAVRGDFGQKVLLHEYAHHHMFASTGQSYPAWYVEGFAEYFMTATFFPTRVEFGLYDAGRARSLALPWLDWDRVIGREQAKLQSDQVLMFYAQSWLLTHYMFRAPGMSEKLVSYLRAVASGTDPLAAFKAHVQPDTKLLNGILRTYMRKSAFSRLTRTGPDPVAVTVRDLPASAGDMIMLHAALDTRGADAPDAKAALARVQDAAARHPGDGLAARTLAMAELYWGDKAKASTLFDGLLAAFPDDPELLRLKAEALLAADAQANRTAARRLLVRAAKLAPTDWRAMHVYVHTYDIQRGPVDDNLFDVVQRMWELAPQASGIVIDMATVLVRKGRMTEAAKVLEPVAFAPHGGGFAALARSLRDAALASDAAAYARRLQEGPPKPEPAAP